MITNKNARKIVKVTTNMRNLANYLLLSLITKQTEKKNNCRTTKSVGKKTKTVRYNNLQYFFWQGCMHKL